MARGGITLKQVEKARNALLARGESASIDAVRMELGNTGSKSTIHKHLKTIEELDETHDNKPSVSEELQMLIQQVAARLQQEANEKLNELTERHNTETAKLTAALESAEQGREQLLADNGRLRHNVIDIEGEKKQAEALVNEQAKMIDKLTEQISSANSQVDLLKHHNASLEQKHQDARNTLQHYRESVSRQREQDLARHDDAIAQYQQQVRELNFTVSTLKESESRVAREYSQIASESKKIAADYASIKQTLVTAEQQIQDQSRTNIELDTLNKQLSLAIDNANKQIKSLSKRLNESENFHTALTSENAGLKGEVLTLQAVLDKYVESSLFNKHQ